MPPFPTLQEIAGLIVKGLYNHHDTWIMPLIRPYFLGWWHSGEGIGTLKIPAQKRFLYSLSSIIMVQLKTAKYLKRSYYWRDNQFFIEKTMLLGGRVHGYICNISQTLIFTSQMQWWLTNTICTTIFTSNKDHLHSRFCFKQGRFFTNPVFQWRPERDGTSKSIQPEKK